MERTTFFSSFKVQCASQLCVLASKYFRNGDLQRAKIASQIALRFDSANIIACYTLAAIDVKCKLYRFALDRLKQILSTRPSDATLHMKIAEAYFMNGNRALFEDHAKQALALSPSNPDLLLACARTYRTANMLGQSMHYLNELSAVDPDHYEMLILASQNYNDLNERQKAVELLERAASGSPNKTRAYFLLSRMNYYQNLDNPHIGTMIGLVQSMDCPAEDKRSLHFTLGGILDSLHKWDNAFFHFHKGNALVKNRELLHVYKRKLNKNVLLIRTAFSKEFLSRFRDSSLSEPYRQAASNLVFIVGMPRSGSSLVEQILASHPKVKAGGERNDMYRMVQMLPRDLGEKRRYPACLRSLNEAQLEGIGNSYLSCVQAELAHQVWTDKSLGNFAYLGLISILFPGAKIINCIRNPYDMILSTYFQYFDPMDVSFANDMRKCAYTYNMYIDLMKFWLNECNIFVKNVRYEELVGNSVDTIKSLVAFCGLVWDPVCLDFHLAERATNTASSFQVKRPIYSDSIDRWRYYEKYMKDIREIIRVE